MFVREKGLGIELLVKAAIRNSLASIIPPIPKETPAHFGDSIGSNDKISKNHNQPRPSCSCG